jgi:hypothetical protein
VEQVVARHEGALAALWKQARLQEAPPLQPLVRQMMSAVLEQLYPGSHQS